MSNKYSKHPYIQTVTFIILVGFSDYISPLYQSGPINSPLIKAINTNLIKSYVTILDAAKYERGPSLKKTFIFIYYAINSLYRLR